ncbi:hybrid signal transduction histidine kinase I isoform X2 [Drosophila hydei]|uniref:Hybrid signal transduction histidine kinase I isoform X2 n=1 Tax=Drosophila hydei TaxID=7224 RepID=A0A6J2SWK3_DROHY|nr:hybrid signal transduction histidine kinase I isoform X2 [Drosophila hydei]
MSCISSNFSSFFLNSLNDPSEFSKYLSNGELKCTNFEEFQVFAQSTQQQQQQQLQQQQQPQSQYSCTNGVGSAELGFESAATLQLQSAQREAAETPAVLSTPLPSNRWPTAVATPNGHVPASAAAAAAAANAQHFDGSFEFIKYLRHSTDFTPSSGNSNASGSNSGVGVSVSSDSVDGAALAAPAEKSSKLIVAGRITTPPPGGATTGGGGCSVGLLDLDSTNTTQKSRSASRKVAALLSSVSRSSNSLDARTSALDAVFDHDSKQTIFELQHLTSTSNGSNGSNSNESSSLELLAFPSSHLNASNSNTSSEEHCGSAAEFGGLLGGSGCSAASGAGGAPKLLGSFVIKENFDVHPSHKVEEGIFQHMNKLPSKKKDTLKQLGVRFTGQMTLTDKSIVVDNFIKFCEEYDIKDHRPWLSLNQCGLNKPEQIKFARYLGQGLPTFTLFCIYSNFKNLFCTKRTEIYTKDGYNLPYILDKTKRFLANTTAGENTNNNNNNSNKTNTTTSTQLKQTQELCESAPASPIAAPAAPATTTPTTTPNSSNNNNTHATGNSSTHLHTQQAAQSQQQQPQSQSQSPLVAAPTGTPMPRPGTPTTPANQQHTHLMQQHASHHLQQQQQQQQQQQPQPSTPTRGPSLTPHHHQQQHPQHVHHAPPLPHHYQHPHPHSHPQQHPHPHPHPHSHPHHFAYAHSHHSHYNLPPHPHPHAHPHQHPHPHPHPQHQHPHAHMATPLGYGQQVAPTAPPTSAQPPPPPPPHALPPNM